MAIQGEAWPELDADEWVRGSWPAWSVNEGDGSGLSESTGTLILTNRRLIFAGSSPHEFVAAVFGEFTAVHCTQRRLPRNTLIIETSSSERFVFRTKKIACKQIEARSHMRLLTRS